MIVSFTDRYAPTLMLLYAATFWGVAWYPLRLLEAAGLHGAWQIVVCYVAAISLLLLVARPALTDLRKHSGKLLLMSLAVGWANLGFIMAMLEGTVVRALLLFYLSPIWTVILGHFLLGEHLSRISRLTMPIALAGSVMMVWEPGIQWIWPPNPADIMALTAGIGFALANVLTRDLQNLGTRQKTLASWFGTLLVGGVVILLYSPQIPQVTANVWLAAVALGLAGFFTATLAAVYGLSRMPVQRSAVILLLEILVGATSAWLIVGETLDLAELLGGTMILTAGFVAATRKPGT